MQHLLILFTKGFPYHSSEPFLEQEYPLYRDYFDKVLIITGCSRRDRPTRQITDPTIEIIPDFTLSKDPLSILESIPLLLRDRMFFRELKELIFSGSFTVGKLYDLLAATLCADHRAMLAAKWLEQHPDCKVCAIYGYWMNIPARAAVRLRELLHDPSIPVTARCHGYDIFAERHRTGYLPYQSQLICALDHIAPASLAGKRYLENRYGPLDKIRVCYLGAADQGSVGPCKDRDILRLVSCARVVPLKRLERIVDALALITDRPIQWTHFGGGDGLDGLKAYASRKLPTNVTVHFPGTVPNAAVYEAYRRTPFHAFLSVSGSEGGAPVSLCEAISFGIPVIATAVGGQPEVVEDGINGYLIPRDFLDRELAQQIRKLAELPEAEYRNLRKNARKIFTERFRAGDNHRKFIEEVLLAPGRRTPL